MLDSLVFVVVSRARLGQHSQSSQDTEIDQAVFRPFQNNNETTTPVK
jgi:hypothetical protein